MAEIIVCPECGKECKGKGGFASHMKAKHPDWTAPTADREVAALDSGEGTDGTPSADDSSESSDDDDTSDEPEPTPEPVDQGDRFRGTRLVLFRGPGYGQIASKAVTPGEMLPCTYSQWAAVKNNRRYELRKD